MNVPERLEAASVTYGVRVCQAYVRPRILFSVDHQDKKAFGRRLRQARDAKGFSQDHVATWFSIDRASVASWELGSTLPGAEKLPVISARLGVSLDYLFNTKPGKPYTVSQVNPDKEIDIELLETVISEVDAHFVTSKPQLNAERRSKIVASLYQECLENGRPPNRKMVARYLRLVA